MQHTLLGLKVTKMDCCYMLIQNQCAGYSLVFYFLSLLTVVREYQTEVIVVPVLLVGVFVIVLTVILWLHCRGLRAKQAQSAPAGPQGKKMLFNQRKEYWFHSQKPIPFPHHLRC